MSEVIRRPAPEDVCPFCGVIGSVVGNEVTFERAAGWPIVTQECSCASCGSRWVDVYAWHRALRLDG